MGGSENSDRLHKIFDVEHGQILKTNNSFDDAPGAFAEPPPRCWGDPLGAIVPITKKSLCQKMNRVFYREFNTSLIIQSLFNRKKPIRYHEKKRIVVKS
jgi:hypothetical protein